MSDPKRNKNEPRLITFSGGVFADMPDVENPCVDLVNLMPPMGGGKGLEPRDGCQWLYQIEPDEGDDSIHIYLISNPDDMTRTNIVACMDVTTREVLHLTEYNDQEGRKSIPPLGGGTLYVTATAMPDIYFTIVDTALSVDAPGVLGNDEDLLEPSEAVKVTDPINGSVTFNADGSFEYEPNTSFTGIDQFTYQIDTDGQLSNVTTITISVAPSGGTTTDGFSLDTTWTPPTSDPGDSLTFRIEYTGTRTEQAFVSYMFIHDVYEYETGTGIIYHHTELMGAGTTFFDPEDVDKIIGVTTPAYDSAHSNGDPLSYQRVVCVVSDFGPVTGDESYVFHPPTSISVDINEVP